MRLIILGYYVSEIIVDFEEEMYIVSYFFPFKTILCFMCLFILCSQRHSVICEVCSCTYRNTDTECLRCSQNKEFSE